MIEELRQRLADLESRQHATGAGERAGERAVSRCEQGCEQVSEGENPDARLAPTVSFLTQVIEAWRAPLSCCAEDDLIEAVDRLGALQQAKEAMLLRVVTELESRGVPSPGGLSRVDWLRSLDPTLTAAAARAIVVTAAALTATCWRGLGEDLAEEKVTVGKAAQVIELHARLAKVADPADLEQAVDRLLARARSLRPEELARACRLEADQLTPPKDLDRLDAARASARGLWFSRPNHTGMVNLTGVLDPEGAAVLRSAIDPLAAPAPLTDQHGHLIEPDPRPAHQRRADALVEIVARGVSAPGAAPTTDKAKIVVTIDHKALQDALCGLGASSGGSGGRRPAAQEGVRTAGGVCQSGEVLSPATARRLACDAEIIPVVLGSESQPLDVGRSRRLVTPAIRTALWLRDRGCTFPGCTAPATWTDAHHVTHWADGGVTALSNLALLCRRHHSHVHQRHLTATITPAAVTWHTWQQWHGAFARRADQTDVSRHTDASGHTDTRSTTSRSADCGRRLARGDAVTVDSGLRRMPRRAPSGSPAAGPHTTARHSQGPAVTRDLPRPNEGTSTPGPGRMPRGCSAPARPRSPAITGRPAYPQQVVGAVERTESGSNPGRATAGGDPRPGPRDAWVRCSARARASRSPPRGARQAPAAAAAPTPGPASAAAPGPACDWLDGPTVGTRRARLRLSGQVSTSASTSSRNCVACRSA